MCFGFFPAGVYVVFILVEKNVARDSLQKRNIGYRKEI